VKARALVIINPGNPTGQCLPRETMVEILSFCAERGLLLMADEVRTHTRTHFGPPLPPLPALLPPALPDDSINWL
jgi:bifunctional pyridoxal-dependent enzyme with beta-cystathionase and maltose regulon repressor activities